MILISKFFNTYFFEKSIKTLPIIIMQRHTFVYKTRFCSRHKNRLYRDIPTFFLSFMHRLFIRERSIKRSIKIKDQCLASNREFQENLLCLANRFAES